MKIITRIVLFLTLFSVQLSSFAIEEVVLGINGESSEEKTESGIADEDWYFDMGGKTLQEKLAEIRAKEITNTDKANYLLEEVLTKKYENSPIKTLHLFACYRGSLNMNFYPDDNDLGYDYSLVDVGINGKLRDNKSYYEARFRLTPQHDYNFFQFLPSNFYIANASIPNHTIIVGNTRTPTGYEGAKSSLVIPFVARSQISRNFGNTRQLGVRVKGNYDLVEYDLGGYSSDTYFEEFFPGAEFAGWVTLKPLEKLNNKYGKLKLGGGLTSGHNNIDYTVLGAYASYEYKKLYANFEWGKADGYNGGRGLFSNKAEGFYTTLGYKITPKIQLVGRYDTYRPNLHIANNTQREISTGINYFLKGQAIKMMLNYVYCQNDAKADSHRIILGTQFLL